MEIEFESDPDKAETNLRTHGVSFDETSSAFGYPLSITVPDPRHSGGAERFTLFGRSERGRLLAVMHTERGERIRIISARFVTRSERRQYEEGID